MTISPTPLPADQAPAEREYTRLSYDWGSVVPGEWARWIDPDDENMPQWHYLRDADKDEVLRAITRVRVAAKWHADHNGLKLQSRRNIKAKTLDLRFTRQ